MVYPVSIPGKFLIWSYARFFHMLYSLWKESLWCIEDLFVLIYMYDGMGFITSFLTLLGYFPLPCFLWNVMQIT